MLGHSSPKLSRGRGRGRRRSYRDTPYPNPNSAGSQSSPSVSTHAIPSTHLYSQSSLPHSFVLMTQFQKPYVGMPHSFVSMTIVLPVSYPPETTLQSIPAHSLTFHPPGGPYPYSFMRISHAPLAISFPAQNVDPSPHSQWIPTLS